MDCSAHRLSRTFDRGELADFGQGGAVDELAVFEHQMQDVVARVAFPHGGVYVAPCTASRRISLNRPDFDFLPLSVIGRLKTSRGSSFTTTDEHLKANFNVSRFSFCSKPPPEPKAMLSALQPWAFTASRIFPSEAKSMPSPWISRTCWIEHAKSLAIGRGREAGPQDVQHLANHGGRIARIGPDDQRAIAAQDHFAQRRPNIASRLERHRSYR